MPEGLGLMVALDGYRSGGLGYRYAVRSAFSSAGDVYRLGASTLVATGTNPAWHRGAHRGRTFEHVEKTLEARAHLDVGAI